MPITNVNSSADKGPGGGGRTTFRPPWVKGEGPQPVPMPTTPWSKRNSLTTDAAKENGQSSQKEVKLQSREVKVPVTTTTKKSPAQPLKKKDDKKEEEEEKKPSGSAADKSGKFVRPVLKKTGKVEEATKPPATTDKKPVPVGKSKAPVVEESSEEEEESSYEEVTETETETDSDEPPPISNKKGKCQIYFYEMQVFFLDNEQTENWHTIIIIVPTQSTESERAKLERTEFSPQFISNNGTK